MSDEVYGPGASPSCIIVGVQSTSCGAMVRIVRMRVLFVTNRFPGILTRGDQLRAFQQIRHLSRRHSITLLTFGTPQGTVRERAELEACCERVIVARRNRIGMAWRALRAWFTGEALQVAIYDAVPRSVGLDALLADARFDLAHVQLARLGPMLRRLAPLPCVLDLVDALSLNMARRALLDPSPLGFVARMEAERLARFERQLGREAAGLAISSAADREAIGAEHAQLVGNGVDLERFAFAADPVERGPNLVFIGNLGYFPNVDAAAWLVEEVMPRLLRRVPDARLKLVGARPARRLRRIVRNAPGVELVGPVADVYPFLTGAAVAVVPLRSGTGQQLKVLEAMAAGTPVVATSRSAIGLQVEAGKQLLIADDAEAIADAIARLLADASLRMRLAAAARDFVEHEHSWERSARDLERLWLAAAACAPRATDTAPVEALSTLAPNRTSMQ